MKSNFDGTLIRVLVVLFPVLSLWFAKKQVSEAHQPSFALFQHVRAYIRSDSGDLIESKGFVCGLLVEDSGHYPTGQFCRDGWWYDVVFYNLSAHPRLPSMYREWMHESELHSLL